MTKLIKNFEEGLILILTKIWGTKTIFNLFFMAMRREGQSSINLVEF